MTGAKTSPPRFGNLPEVRVFRATAVANEPQLLPSLPGTALHGALSDVLAEGGSDLLTPPDRRLPGLGVTDQPPAPLALAPTRFASDAHVLELAAGEPFGFRLAVVGERAGKRSDELLAAVEAALERGLGLRPGNRAARPRPSLRLVRWDEEPSVLDGRERPPGHCRMTLLTPLRLRTDGRITSSPDGAALRDAIVRRADALAQLYGDGPLFRGRPLSLEPPDVEDALLRVVDVVRYSRRQERRMSWPGLVGELVLSGAGLAAVWRLLRFCEQVQLGKATGFGFGWFRLQPLLSSSPLG